MNDFLTSEEIIECVVTLQDTIAELISIETKLAIREGLTYNPDVQNYNRVLLWMLTTYGKLAEDELVKNWHETYSSYANSIEDQPLYAKVYVKRTGEIGRIVKVLETIETPDGDWSNETMYEIRFSDDKRRKHSNREIIYL